MSDDMIRRLDLVQSYFVREGLGFDEKCIAIEEARDLIKAQALRLGDLQTRFDAVWQRAEKLDAAVGERDGRLNDYERRLSDCESALRSLDVGRESSYWVVEIPKRGTREQHRCGSGDGWTCDDC